jgi:hypothetical protein
MFLFDSLIVRLVHFLWEEPQRSTHSLPVEAFFVTAKAGISPFVKIRTLRTALHEHELRGYLQQRNDWSNETYNSTSWSAYRSASAGLTDNVRTLVVKFRHNWLLIGVCERRRSATTDLCQQWPRQVFPGRR